MQTARAARCALTSIFLTLILSCNLTNNRLTEEIVFLSAHAQGHMAGIGAFVSVDQSVRLFTTWPLGAQGGEPKCEKCLDELVPGTTQREWWRRSYRTTWSDPGRNENPSYLTPWATEMALLYPTGTTVCGRVEWKRDGQWGTICDFDYTSPMASSSLFENEDAQVFCRHLGLSGGQVVDWQDNSFKGDPGFKEIHPTMASFLTSNLSCAGSEATLDACPIQLGRLTIDDSTVGTQNCFNNSRAFPAMACCSGDAWASLEVSVRDPSSCAPCLPGMYKPANGTMDCVFCPVGKYSEGTTACPEAFGQFPVVYSEPGASTGYVCM